MEREREKRERKISDPSSCSSRDEKLGKKDERMSRGKEKDEDVMNQRKNDVSSRNKMFDERKGSDE